MDRGILKEDTWKPGLRPPRALTLAITGICNLTCGHCLVEGGPKAREPHVPADTVRRIVSEFAALGGEEIYITGGEPLLHPRWLDILTFCCEQQSFTSVVVQTNAALLGDARVRAMCALQFEGLAIPAPVNYVGKGANLFDLGYQADGSIEVIINYLRTTWIWDRVRIQGGAYGGFCLFNHRTGVFTFLSYRDPNLLQTLDNYDQTAAFLRNLELERDEMVKSIIGSIGDMDAYLLPDAKGYVSMNRYMTGETDDVRQTWRDQLLDTSLADFRALGEHLQRLNEAASVVVLGSPEALAKANAEKGGWLEVRKVM